MPSVPRYGAPKTRRQALPGVRLSPNAPDAAFRPPQPVDFSAVTQVAARIHEEETRRADQVALLGAQTDLARTRSELLYGQNGVLNREGQNAFSASEEVREAWTKATADIEKKHIKNERQRGAFEAAVTDDGLRLNEQVERHVSEERKKFDAAQTDAFIDSQTDAAVRGYQNPDEISTAIGQTVAALNDWGKAHGVGPDVLEQAVSARVSRIHMGVIDQMTADDKDLLASQYFQQNKGQIAPKDLPKVQRALEESSLRGESQRQADQIMRKYGSETEAAAAVKEITDPKVRDEVQKRVEHEWSQQRRREREDGNDLYIQAANMIDARPGTGVKAITPAVWQALKPTQRRSLQVYAKSVGGGSGGSGGGDDEGTQNPSLYLQFLDLTPQQLGQMNQSEFMTKYWSKFDKSHRGKAETEWKNARDKVRAPAGTTAAAGTSLGSLRQMVKTQLEKSKLVDPRKTKSRLTPEEAQMPADVYDEVEDTILEREQDGKKLTPVERKQVVDQVILGRVFSTSGRKTIDVKQKGKLVAQVIKEGDGTVRVPYNRIPKDQQEKIKAALTQKGAKSISRDRIERAYGALALSNYTLYESILAER